MVVAETVAARGSCELSSVFKVVAVHTQLPLLTQCVRWSALSAVPRCSLISTVNPWLHTGPGKPTYSTVQA